LQKKSFGTTSYWQEISEREVEDSRRGRPARSEGGHRNCALVMVVVVVLLVVVVVVNAS
jgi:predicted metalloprotease